jgi:hypothetical protein
MNPAPRIIDLCGQALCLTDASHSFVWPGQGRKFICEKHLVQLRSVARSLGLSVESLDIQEANKP